MNLPQSELDRRITEIRRDLTDISAHLRGPDTDPAIKRRILQRHEDIKALAKEAGITLTRSSQRKQENNL